MYPQSSKFPRWELRSSIHFPDPMPMPFFYDAETVSAVGGKTVQHHFPHIIHVHKHMPQGLQGAVADVSVKKTV